LPLNKYKLLRDFEALQKLGSGGFGIVVRARKTGKKTPFAIKLIPFGDHLSYRKHSLEAQRLSKIEPHPCVIQCMDFWIDSLTRVEFQQFVDFVKPRKNEVFGTFPSNSNSINFLCIQMELCGNGNLRTWLKRRQALTVTDVDFMEAIKIFIQVGAGIDQIHKQGLIHRDLKPGNILFDGNQAKLSYPGYAAELPGERVDERNAIAKLYRAPEQALEDSSWNGKAVDFFALGLILFELFYPPAQKNIAKTIHGLINSGSVPGDLRSRFPYIAKLIMWMLSIEASHRPNAAEILYCMKKWAPFSKLSPKAYELTINSLAYNCKWCRMYLTDPKYQCPTHPGSCFLVDCSGSDHQPCTHPFFYYEPDKSKCQGCDHYGKMAEGG